MTVKFSTWIDSLVPVATTLAATDKIAIVTDAPDSRAITRDNLARSVYATVMTTDGDLITRSGGEPTRITRSGLAASIAPTLADDAAFTNKYTQLTTLTTDGDLYTRAGGVVTRITRASLADDTAFTSKYTALTTIDAKGDLYVGTADNAVSRLAVGTNGHALVADSLEATGLKWSAMGDVTLTGTETLTNKTLTAPVVNGGLHSEIVLKSAEERWSIAAIAATGTVNVDTKTASAWYYSADAAANWTFNFRGDGSTTLDSLLDTGDSVTVAFAVTNGSTAYYPTDFQIDGVAVTPKWQGGSASDAGNADSIDLYVFSIVKTDATPTYVIYSSQTPFA